MKKVIAILLTGCMIFGLAACGTDKKAEGETKKEETTDTAEKTESKEKITIGYSYPTANNEFWGNALTYETGSRRTRL